MHSSLPRSVCPTRAPARVCVPRPCNTRRSVLVRYTETPQEAGVAGLRTYLSGAIASIFGRLDNQGAPDWKASANSFEGRIEREDRARLRKLYDIVQRVRGCTDPDASNFNPSAEVDDGSCSYNLAVDGTPMTSQEGISDYLQSAVTRLFNHNFTGDSTEPKWEISPYSGKILSQREINDMLRFEKVVSKALSETKSE